MKPLHELENQVRKIRRAADITQEELAEKIGVARQTILSIEKGNYTPSVALALQIAAVFGLRVEDLFQLKKGDADAQSAGD